MTTSMNSLVSELSRVVDDWHEYTASSGSTNTVVASAIAAEQDDFVNSGANGDQPSTVYVKTDAGGSGAAPEGEEKRVASKSTTTITTNATDVFSAAIASGDTVEVHRKWTRQEKEQAIQKACRDVFPSVYKKIHDESITLGSWVRDGSFNNWSSTTALTHWTKTGSVTLTQTTTKPNIYREGSTSVKMSGNTGNISQTLTLNADLAFLAGRSVTLYARVKCDTASCARIAIYDGTTTTYSSYHSGANGWGDNDDYLEVTATIASNPTAVTFFVYQDNGSGTTYVDEVWMDGAGYRTDYDISDLGLHQNIPSQVFRIADRSYPGGLAIRLNNWIPPTTDGRLRFKDGYYDGSLLRIIGMGYLTQPTSLYGSSTTATSTEVDEPQVQIIIAEAAKYLYKLRLNSGTNKNRDVIAELYSFGDQEAQAMRTRFSMPQIPVQRLS